MLRDRPKTQPPADSFFNNFFHSPTLVTLAVISVVILGQVYNLNVDLGQKFVRLNSNRGNVTLFWINGCCDLAW